MSPDAEPHDASRRGDDADIWLLTGAPVDEEQLVSADTLELRARCRNDAEAAIREAVPHVRIRDGRNDDVGAFLSPQRGARRAAVVAVQRHVMRDQAAPGCSGGEFHGERKLLRFAARFCAHGDLSRVVPVNPAARVRGHLERRGRIEQMPLLAELNEHSLSVRAEQAQVAVHRRKKPVDAHVALGDHRMKHAAHPHGGGQRCFVGCEMATRAEQMPVGPLHAQLFRSQNDVTIRVVKERQAVCRARRALHASTARRTSCAARRR